MLIERSDIKLVSLLLVFLTENFETGMHQCNICDSTTPSYGKSFRIGGAWVCVDCIIERIRTNPC